MDEYVMEVSASALLEGVDIIRVSVKQIWAVALG
jgi:hypothetical protein